MCRWLSGVRAILTVVSQTWGRPACDPGDGWVVVDVETSGFRPGHARVLSVAALVLDPDGSKAIHWLEKAAADYKEQGDDFHFSSAKLALAYVYSNVFEKWPEYTTKKRLQVTRNILVALLVMATLAWLASNR